MWALREPEPLWAELGDTAIVTVAPGDRFEQVWVPSDEPVQVRRVELSLGAGASACIFALNTAEQYGRIELDVSLAAGADFNLFAANIGSGTSTNEIVTVVRHLEPDATSRQMVRSVLGGKAVGTYLGKVAVARHAQHSDSEQSVKAMLLDRGATANAKPELEIYADDVKCAHGASVGELDPEQMFYAMSRGLDPASARALLLEGFVGGLWDALGNDSAIALAANAALRRIA